MGRIASDSRCNFMEIEALVNTKISAMCISHQDEIWFGTEDGNLCVYDGDIALLKQYMC